jgi:hypothetical protein
MQLLTPLVNKTSAVTTGDAWNTVDCAADVPVGATAVVIQVRNGSGAGAYFPSFRPTGGTATTFAALAIRAPQTLTAVVPLDASRRFDFYCGGPTGNYTLQLVAYFESEFVSLVSPVERTHGAGGTWKVEDWSAAIPSGAVALVGVVDSYGSGSANVRARGSTDSRVPDSMGALPFVAALNAGREMEWRTPYNTDKIAAIGYLTSGFTGLSNGSEISLTTTGSYVDLPAAPTGAVAMLVETAITSNDSWYLRRNGNSDDGYGAQRHTASHHFVGLDASRIAEAKISATTVDMFATGYFGIVAAPPTVTSVDTDNVVVAGQANVAVAGSGLTNATFALVQGAVTSALVVDSTTDTTAQIDISLGNCKYGAASVRATTVTGTGSKSVTVTPETGTKFIDLGTPNTTAANRITAIPDLQASWQLRVYDVTGATIDDITLYDDGTFSAPPGCSFQVEANNGVEWGASGLQTTPGSTITITQQPQSTTVVAGGVATFTIAATGATSYQWRKNGVAISGATGTSYTTPAVVYPGDDGALFSCLVTGPGGSLASSNATLTVTPAVVPNLPVIVQQPQSVSVTEGETATFTVVANFADSYQWRRNGAVISGGVAASYTTPVLALGDSGALYDCVVTGAGGDVTSAVAVVTVAELIETPTVIGAKLVERIKRALSRKADSALDADIMDELNWAQEKLETAKSKPYFLRKWVTVEKVGAHEYIDLPTAIPGFLKL